MFRKIIFFFALFISMVSVEGYGSAQHVAPSLFLEHQKGEKILAAVHLEISPGWHAYWKNPGGVGYPPSIEWHLPEGFVAKPAEWPAPEKFESPLGSSFGYTGDLWLISEMMPPLSWDGSPVEIKAKVKWLVCSEDTCLPGEKELAFVFEKGKGQSNPSAELEQAQQRIPKELAYISHEKSDEGVILHLPEPHGAEAYFYPEKHEVISYEQHYQQGHLTLNWHDEPPLLISLIGTLVVVDHKGEKESWNVNLPLTSEEETPVESAGFYQQLLATLGLAFLGGMILNLMPCVLPVISLKIFSFCNMAGQNRKEIFKHGLLFVGGVLISFWILAGALIILQAYGNAVGWGFQLQEPIFVASLAAVLFVFSLSLFGVFEVGTLFASWAGQKQSDGMTSRNSLWSSFFSGILATAVATPCTGPFLGSAVGFALTLPPIWALMIFTSLGLGMSTPYLLLSAFPQLLRFIPKPGAWMVTFKEILGFCMVATTLWLVWVFSAQTDEKSLFSFMTALLCLSFGAWVLGKWAAPFRKKKIRLAGLGFGAVCFLYAGYMIVKASSVSPMTENQVAMIDKQPIHRQDGWEVYDGERIKELQKKGTPVFVDFTAKWCLSCQANHLVLTEEHVENKFNEHGVVKMIGDWTRRDAIITAALQELGRSGVPLYLLYDGQGEVTILPQVLTPDIVIEYLEQIDTHKHL